jgi:ABC-type branched-subunit amino acid transport system ATPase component
MMLQLSGVHAHYGYIHALHGVDVSVQVGEVVTLIGANGAGKSTLMMSCSASRAPRPGASSSTARTSPAADARDRPPRHRPGARRAGASSRA